MDVIRAVLDGIAIAAIFNGAVAVWVLINPRYFFDSYPKAIQKSAHEQMTKKEKKINLILTIVICGICFIYSAVSLLHTKLSGFWNLFWMGYIQWSILNLGDFFLLDCLLFQGKYKDKIEIPCILISLFYSSNHNLCPKFQPLPSRINTSYGIIPKTNKKWPQPTKSLKLFSQYVSLYLTRLFELRKSCWEICDSQRV